MLHSTGPARSQRRKSSRTNSDSSSVVTVKKAASISSRSGSRTPHSATRPRSPDELGPQLTALLQSTFDPGHKNKRSSSWSRPGSSAGVKEGVGNLNRWSHSTSSSASGQENTQGRKRKNSNSKHISYGPLPNLGSGTIDTSQNHQTTELRSTSRNSPVERLSRRDAPFFDPTLKLPPLSDLGTLSRSTNTLQTPSTASATPLTAELLTPSTAPTDYFGEQWNMRQRATSQSQAGARLAKNSESPKLQRSTLRQPQPENADVSNPAPSFQAAITIPEGEPRYRDPSWRAGHSRGYGPDGTGSGNTDSGTSISSTESDIERPKQRRSPAQKTMLSQALAKANSAVLLDNAQDFEAAIEAYQDACKLLRQVMLRSSGDEDRKKLQAIRTTYTNRIEELLELEQSMAKSREQIVHDSSSSNENIAQYADPDDDDDSDYDMIARDQRPDYPPRRQSLLPFLADGMPEISVQLPSPRDFQPSHRGTGSGSQGSFLSMDDNMKATYMPPPLSPKRPQSAASDTPHASDLAPHAVSHNRAASTETTSWLNTIDESGDSAPSSLNSRNSSIAYGAGFVHYPTDGAEAEFNFALNAAVDAAYNEAQEDGDRDEASNDIDIVSMARRNIELAKEMVREVERETEREAAATEESRRTNTNSSQPVNRQDNEDENVASEYLDDEAEEEERLLEEMTRGYIMDDFEFNIQTKSALPRTSDSSSFSGRTYGSSVGSTAITSGTSLSTLAEILPPTTKQKLPPPLPPPSGALPPPPVPDSAPPAIPTSPSSGLLKPSDTIPLSFDKPAPGPGVRDRRLSGQNAKQLKIETKPRRFSAASGTKPQFPLTAPAVTVFIPSQNESGLGTTTLDTQTDPTADAIKLPETQPSTPLPHMPSAESLQTESPATPALTLIGSHTSEDGAVPPPASPTRLYNKPMPPPPTMLRKNFSSTSLKLRNLSVSNNEAPDASPNTPASASFPLPKEPTREVSASSQIMPTPTASSFTSHGTSEGSLYLFDDSIQIPQTPGTPGGSLKPNAPIRLEPCPDSFLLRPFWLMRCLYQTVAHPRGGYLSTKLFIPRDIWRVKNVKLRAIDDKVSQCDLLTAALLKLGKVDTLDADAVLEEMQSFELILEHVRGTLQKKLGSEVGLSGSAGLFKGAHATDEPQGDPLTSKSSNVPGKSYLSSWRKLRSKSSGAGINSTFSSVLTKDAAGRDTLTLPTLPMTATPSSRPHKPRPEPLQFTGPNANYMSALARLFDAVQVLDQIARQVEDPGLKCSSKTHVGLELCTRNAAEFFGFYICRFALSDIGMMLDKYIKRGSEWALV